MAMRPPLPSLTLSRRAKISLVVVGTLIVVLIVLGSLVGVYVNWLWFGEVGYRGVYRGIITTKLVLFLIFGLLMALILGGNIVVAYLLRPPFRPLSAEQQNLERYRVVLEQRKKARARRRHGPGGPERRPVVDGRLAYLDVVALRRPVRDQGSAVPP